MVQLAYGLEKSSLFVVFCLWFYRLVPLEGSIVEVKFTFLTIDLQTIEFIISKFKALDF